ncbi:MAG: pyrimidine dimer DNA glycosylase/endonuclease V, partial [Desulfobacterota bacterium]|nr:pyrimidine dimer DNA glycosylase/endonuclease V [Thermodesulfobacteriota bacterium]
YKNHPQLIRFKNADNSKSAIANYLWGVADEAVKRGYKFNREKILKRGECSLIPISKGQLEYEFRHLLSKLKVRDLIRYNKLKFLKEMQPHPLFVKVSGGIVDWEVLYLTGLCY